MKRPDKISIILLVAVVLGAGRLPAAEMLYNGIRLPDEWPPRSLDPESDAPMDAPYLKNPPAVIPIGIGRQLFVDDFLIEKTDLCRTFHKARDYAGNPVLAPETAAELRHTRGSAGEQEAVCYTGAGGVFHNPEESLFKMWYTAGWLYFPYTGYSGMSHTGWRGFYTEASVGMAVLRRDGFASMDADKKGGTLTTRPVRFSGRHLFVNVDCAEGALLAEVLDAGGKVISGYAKSDCLPVSANKTLVAVGWKGGRNLAALGGAPVRFRFYLSDGKLYSFWVGRDESGASLGFVAAGGPGYERTYDTKGVAAYKKAAGVMPAPIPLK